MSSKEEIKVEPSLIGDTSRFDTKPVQIDLSEFRDIEDDSDTRFNNFRTYEEGLYVRSKVADKLKGSTSVDLVGLKNFDETENWTDLICPSNEFLVGLFGDYIRENCRPIRGPEWMQSCLNQVSTDIIMSTTNIHSDVPGFKGLASVINNRFNTVGLLSMVETMEHPKEMYRLHSAVCFLKDWLDTHEAMYINQMCNWFVTRKTTERPVWKNQKRYVRPSSMATRPSSSVRLTVRSAVRRVTTASRNRLWHWTTRPSSMSAIPSTEATTRCKYIPLRTTIRK